MSDTMHLVVLESTGHVLAALSQTVAGGEPELSALVGSELPVANVRDRAQPAHATLSLLPLEVLALKTVAFDAAVVANPLRYAVDGGRVVELPPWAAAPPAPNLDDQTIALKGGAADTAGLAVVARQGAPDGDRRVQGGTFPQAGGDLVLPLSILPDDTAAAIATGDYDVFVALAGRRPYWLVDSVP
jgi:hypothetical protein